MEKQTPVYQRFNWTDDTSGGGCGTPPPAAVVVDADEAQAGFLAGLLRGAGLEASAFRSAEDALSAIDPHRPPALVVTDLLLPGIDGWRFCRLLRTPEYAAFNGTPILVVSPTFAGEDAARVASDAGADAFLPAPVSGERFVERARQMIDGGREWNQPRALVVEDVEALAVLLQSAFATGGYRADASPSAEAAMAAFAATPYDVAVIDHHLPDRDGDSLLEDFRKIRPGCALVMMTADPSPELALAWMKMGASAYVRKPFDPEYLVGLCEKARRETSLMRVKDILEDRTCELRESERRFRKLFETMAQGVVYQDAGGRITSSNPAAERILGLSLDQMQGRTSLDPQWRCLKEDGSDFPGGEHPAMVSLRTGLPVHGTIMGVYHPVKGEHRWILVGATPEFTPGETSPCQVLTTFTDITELRRSEEALRNRTRETEDSRAIFSAIFQQNQAAMALSTWPETVLLDVNEAWVLCTGVPRDEAMGRIPAHSDMFPDKGAMQYVLDSLNAEGRVVDAEITLRHRSGQVKTLLWSGQVTEIGGVPHLVSSAVDITERKGAERELADTKAMLEAAFEETEIPMALATVPDCIVRIVNQAALEVLQIEDEPSPVGMRLFDLKPSWRDYDVGGIQLSAPDLPLPQAIAGKKTKNRVMGVLRKDGSWRWTLVSGSPIYNASGEQIAAFIVFPDITERRLMEVDLRRNEARNRALLDAIPDLMFVFSDDGLITDYRIGADGLLYAPPEAFLGKPFADVLPPDVTAMTLDRMDRLSRSGQLEIYEYSLDIGGLRHFESRLAPCGTDQYLAIVRDITDRKHTEEALQESEARLRAIFECSVDAIAVSANGVHIMANPAYMKMFGIGCQDELAGLRVADLIGLSERERVGRYVAARSRGEHAPNNYVTVGRRLDGLEFPMEVSVSQYTIGDTVYTVPILRDVAERVVAEETLRESRERFAQVAELSGELIWEVDREGLYVYVNPVVAKVVGYSEGEIVGKMHFYDLFAAKNREELLCQAFAAFENRRPFRDFYNQMVTKDGRVIDLVTNGLPVLAPDGSLVGYRGSGRDITEQLRAEKERERLQAQLLQAQKMESVGRLAGGVAHDFNNMLQVIIGLTELALFKVEPAQPIHADLNGVKNAAQRSADLTRQLLAFARKQAVMTKPVDLNETVAVTLKMLRRLIGENIELVWAPGETLWLVEMDPGQVDQILANVCVNARDAISGVGTITITTGNAALDAAYCASHGGFAPGEYVRLSVTDDGCGMEAETIEHIFEPFFTTKEMGRGTGLGLATVYGIVRQNNGFITVSSERGKGSAFDIYVPKLEGAKGRARVESQTDQVLRGMEKILLVEDEPAILAMGRAMLERLGYSVTTAGTPVEAIRAAEEHLGEIHLLITDVVMPEMNGRDLARRLLSLHPSIKRLFMSGYTAEVIAHQGDIEAGVHFIQKPFTIDALASKLREVLEGG